MHHGTVIMIEDCESNEHCSITVYHQELDAILSKSEEGYIVLNPEVVELIRRTKEEEKEESESSERREGVLMWMRRVIVWRSVKMVWRSVKMVRK